MSTEIIKNGMDPIHPGEILGEETEHLSMTPNAFAMALDVAPNRITAILKGQRGISADTALRISRYLGTTPDFRLNMRKSYELRVAEEEIGVRIEQRIISRETAAV